MYKKESVLIAVIQTGFFVIFAVWQGRGKCWAEAIDKQNNVW